MAKFIKSKFRVLWGTIFSFFAGIFSLDAVAQDADESVDDSSVEDQQKESELDAGAIAAAVAAAESTQVESALITEIVSPPNSEPESEASLKASSADAAIAGVRDSIGPVNPNIIPILTSANVFVVKVETNINAAINSFFIIFLLIVNNL